MRRRARAASNAGRDGPGEHIRFFALRRARDEYGRQARDEGCQTKKQVECGRAVAFFNMNHGLQRSHQCLRCVLELQQNSNAKRESRTRFARGRVVFKRQRIAYVSFRLGFDD